MTEQCAEKFQTATFDDKEKYNHLSIIKIWTGR